MSSISRELWPLLRGIAITILPIARGVTVACSLFVRLSHEHPAKTAGLKEMPFGKDTRMVPSNIVLDKGPQSSSQNSHCKL